MTPLPDMRLLDTTSVTVVRPVENGTDEYGNPVVSVERENVTGVLPEPGGTTSMTETDREHGVTVDMVFHWPKGYGKPLKGCAIEHDGRAYRVIGDPRPYVDANTPGPFDMTVNTTRGEG